MSVEDSSPCSPRVNATTRPRKIWTPEEDVTLKTLVARYGDARGPQGHWKDIAAALQDRTAKVEPTPPHRGKMAMRADRPQGLPLTTGTPSPRSLATTNRGDATTSDAPEPSLNSLQVVTEADADISNVMNIDDIATSMVDMSTGLYTDDFRFVGDAASYDSILHHSQLSSNLPPSLDLGHVSEPLHQALREPTSNSHNSTPKVWRSNRNIVLGSKYHFGDPSSPTRSNLLKDTPIAVPLRLL
ncbi:hypothetical protein CNYM01_01276 [Colletotrichum nymphaeae SA-01]|uniref:Myb-like domain-containing protein n=1 Tax=Colletotrichum nymphaeae SA-01 TaxID=1460502 RepID=A0A135SMV9_9PEZI|nr:hypothetical protein CNYM01_01276 [Colletotrichum nymphaeae SA-01]